MKQFLKIGCWNVHNIKSNLFNKAEDKLFLKEAQSYDIFCMQETKSEETIFIDKSYFSYCVNRPKQGQFPNSGGMMVLINKCIKNGITILKSKSSEIVWLQLSKQYFGFTDDVYLCYIYIAPVYSSYSIRNNLDIFQILENDIVQYSKMGKIIVMGDTNARTGSDLDQIDNNDKHIPVPLQSEKTRFLRQRNSQDSHVCPRGKDLIDLCIEANLNILNGRTFGDSFGKYTSFQYNGNSVVDYCIVSESLIKEVIYFHVHDHLPYLSDHAKLSLKLKASVANIGVSDENDKTSDMPTSYRWFKDSPFLFQKAFDTHEVKEQIRKFMNSSFTGDNHKLLTDDAVESFNGIIYTVCEKSLKKIKHKNNSRKKTKSKKWFDFDLFKMRKELFRKSDMYSKFPNDPIIRGSFFKFRKLYNKNCKKKCKEFKSSLITQLDNMYEKDPEAYWKLLKDLKEDSKATDTSTAISVDEWHKHFSDLYQIKSKFLDKEKQFQSYLNTTLDFKTFSELDVRIKDKEVLLAIQSLKNNKACGLDGIKNEMLKNSHSHVLPCIVKLFNHILSSGIYPSKWKLVILNRCTREMTPLYQLIIEVLRLCHAWLNYLIVF